MIKICIYFSNLACIILSESITVLSSCVNYGISFIELLPHAWHVNKKRIHKIYFLFFKKKITSARQLDYVTYFYLM